MGIIHTCIQLLAGTKRRKLQHGSSDYDGRTAHPSVPVHPIHVIHDVFSDSESDSPEESFDDDDDLPYVVGGKPPYRSDADMRRFSDFEGKKPCNGYFSGGMYSIDI